MSDLVKIETGEITEDGITTLVNTGIIPMGTPKPQIMIFAQACKETQLSPFKKQIHMIARGKDENRKYSIQTGIDGYRVIAHRSGAYAGNDDIVFDSETGAFPKWARATVYRIVAGHRVAFAARARWSEYAQMFYDKNTKKKELSDTWKKMPYLMLGKCAEALALRKAFPESLSGIYTDEEMQQAEELKTIQEPTLEAPQVESPPTEKENPSPQQAKKDPPPVQQNKTPPKAPPAQKNAVMMPQGKCVNLHRDAKKLGFTKQSLADWLAKNFGVTSTKELREDQFIEVKKGMQNASKELGLLDAPPDDVPEAEDVANNDIPF